MSPSEKGGNYENWKSSFLPESVFIQFNPIALRKTKTPWSFGPSECNRVNMVKKNYLNQAREKNHFLLHLYSDYLYYAWNITKAMAFLSKAFVLNNENKSTLLTFMIQSAVTITPI